LVTGKIVPGVLLALWLTTAVWCVYDSPGNWPPKSVHTTLAIFPAEDIPEMEFFMAVSDMLGPGNYYRHSILIIVTPLDPDKSMRPVDCATNGATLACRVQSYIDTAMDKVTTGVVYDSGALYVDPVTHTAAATVYNTSALITINYRTHLRNETVQLVETLESEFNSISPTEAKVTIVHHDVQVTQKTQASHSEFDWETPATAILGIIILAWAIKSPSSTAITVLNIVLVYFISFRTVGALTDEWPVLTFGPELMLAIIIAFCIDYSLFLIKPYTIAARKGKLGTQQDVVRVLKANWDVIGISCAVLCACFLTLLVVTDVEALKSLAFSCIITVLLTSAANLSVTPSLLCFSTARRWLMPRKTCTCQCEECTCRHLAQRSGTSWLAARIFPIEAAHAEAEEAKENIAQLGHGDLAKLQADSKPVEKSSVGTAAMWRKVIIGLYLIITIVATCWVYGAYDPPSGERDAGSADAPLGQDTPYGQAMAQIDAQYGAGTTSPGQILISGDDRNATMKCIAAHANITDARVISTTDDATLWAIKPPTSLKASTGYQWYTETLPEAKKKCGVDGGGVGGGAAQVIETYFEDQLSLDAIHDIWPKFETIIIPLLLVLCFGTVYLAFGSLLLSVYAAFAVLSMFSVALALLRVVYPTSHTNIYQYPSPGDEPLAFVWFVPIMVVPVVVGIKLDYVTLRLHEYKHRAHNEQNDVEGVRQAVHDATVSISPTIMYAGLIMVVAFSGLLFETAVAAHQIATMLIASLVWITWINEVCVQPVLKYESAKFLVSKRSSKVQPYPKVRQRRHSSLLYAKVENVESNLKF